MFSNHCVSHFFFNDTATTEIYTEERRIRSGSAKNVNKESEMTTNPLDDAPLSTFHKKLAVFSSGGPFLDGYALSIIGVAMV